MEDEVKRTFPIESRPVTARNYDESRDRSKLGTMLYTQSLDRGEKNTYVTVVFGNEKVQMEPN